MPRRKAAIKREVIPDPLFQSEEIAKFINVITQHGKKSISEKIVYEALFMLHERVGEEEGGKGSGSGSKGLKKLTAMLVENENIPKEEVLALLKKALGNITPAVEVKSRRVGGATYQVPIEVPARRGLALAMRWIKKAAKSRSEKRMSDRLAAELYDATKGRGSAVKKRDEVHRMADANKAFAHYRW